MNPIVFFIVILLLPSLVFGEPGYGPDSPFKHEREQALKEKLKKEQIIKENLERYKKIEPEINNANNPCNIDYPGLLKKSIKKNGRYNYSKIPPEIFFNYTQLTVGPKDKLGDIALLKMYEMIPRYFWNAMTGQSFMNKRFNDRHIKKGRECARFIFNSPSPSVPVYGSESEIAEYTRLLNNHMSKIINSSLPNKDLTEIENKFYSGKISIEGKENPINLKGWINMINTIIQTEYNDNNIIPVVGKFHDWADWHLFKNLKSSRLVKISSKMLAVLALGKTNDLFKTGTEDELIGFILKQDIMSIYPHQLLQESYKINNGNLYMALMTIENVLAKFFEAKSRQHINITLRLAPIINHLGKRIDIYGSWYHLFGMMVYSYAKGSIKGVTVGKIDNILSSILTKGEEEAQEDHINIQGGKLGKRFQKTIYKTIKNETYKDENINYETLNPEKYLNLNENFKAAIIKRIK